MKLSKRDSYRVKDLIYACKLVVKDVRNKIADDEIQLQVVDGNTYGLPFTDEEEIDRLTREIKDLKRQETRFLKLYNLLYDLYESKTYNLYESKRR